MQEVRAVLEEVVTLIKEVHDQEVLTQIIIQINRTYERLRPELESVHLLLPKYDRQERKRQMDFCRASILTEEFEK